MLNAFLLATFGMSCLLTWLLRRYAFARSLIDTPNARSSHSVPTPRGGGVAIVVCFSAGVLALWSLGSLAAASTLALCGAGGLVALIGFLDDHGHIAARWRLLGHFTAAIWGLYWLGGLPAITVFGLVADLGWVGHCLAALYLVWLLNLYNFMDGIDGIASVEAICVCLGGALLVSLDTTADQSYVALLLTLAAAVAGFLIWNVPPARIFMGDAGSGFLGITLGVLSLQAAWSNPSLLWSWLILLGVFIVDATFTLARRLLRGDKIYEAHCSHAYQHASRYYGRHLPVTAGVFVINVVWLIPLAVFVGQGWLDGLSGLIIAYVPLLVAAVRFRAGA